ncbi:MAG TPA: DUF4153 domain-containing protein [Stellaceae bacterium]|nr:DUF4153 domain-containing protein [Stellaceae bacterium]
MRSVSGYRFAIGLLQGGALSLLYLAYDERSWPATNGELFAPLLLVALLVPLLVIQSMRGLRLRTLIGWTIVATALIAALAYYDIWRAWPQDWVSASAPPYGAWQPHILPSARFMVALLAILFIAHALIVSADADSRLIADYTIYFDVAWEQGIQLALTAIFVGVFWALMWLGAAMFELLKLDFLAQLFRHHWFWIPATTLATAIGIHVTDARVGLVRGTRVLALTLLALLLPLMTVLLIGFLGAPVLTGLERLWNTRHGSALLIFAAVVILVLINAAYQDGPRDRHVPSLLRFSARIAAILPLPLVALAAYALALRIAQYGWTADRILGTAAVIVVACHAIGYAWAAFAHPWLRPIERWNVYCALVTLAALLALFSPLADPARISVDDQMARVENGKTPADKLDLDYLRWDAGRYGKAALETVAARPGDSASPLKTRAGLLLAAKSRYDQQESPHPLAENLVIHAADGKLPDSFLAQDWRVANDYNIPACLHAATTVKCEVFVKDLKGDGSPQIIIVLGATVSGFDRNAAGTWRLSAQWQSFCSDMTEALRKGEFAAAAAAPSPWPDLDVAGQRLGVAPPNRFTYSCPKT